MSVKQMAKVWDLQLDHAQRLVLLALADHAHDDGGGVRPSLGLVAWKTGYSLASVNRIMAQLRRRGLIEVERQGGGRQATHYILCLDQGQTKDPYKPLWVPSEPAHFDTPVTRDRAALSPVIGEPSVEPSVTTSSSLLSSLEDLQDLKTNGKKEKVPGDVRALVDQFRALPGVGPSKKDGGVIAGLVGKYGAVAVGRVLEDDSPSIGAADNPLMYLASRFKRSRGGGGLPERTLAERKAEILRTLKGSLS